MTLCAPEELFFRDNGSGEDPAPIFEATDFGPLATGVCVMSVNQAKIHIKSQSREEPFSSPCAILCACSPAEWASLHASNNSHVIARVHPEQCSPFFVGTTKVPRQEKCMLFQFGSEYVVINDQSPVTVVKGDIAEYVQVSVQCPNLNGTNADEFTAKAKSKFKEAATLIVQACNLYKDDVPYWSRPWTMQWKGGQLQREDGLARVPLSKVETVLRRSGLHDMIVDMTGDTRDLYDYYNLAPSVTMVQARGQASALKELAFGITMRRDCYAIRIKPGTQQLVDLQLKPELHQAMGDSLAALPRVEGCKLMLCGVPSGYSDIDIISNVEFRGATPWKCKPIGTCNGKARCKVPGKKNVLVIAHSLPPKRQLQLQHAHVRCMITIEPVATVPRSSWDGCNDTAPSHLPDGRSSRAGPNLGQARHSEPACPDTFGQSLLPRPEAFLDRGVSSLNQVAPQESGRTKMQRIVAISSVMFSIIWMLTTRMTPSKLLTSSHVARGRRHHWVKAKVHLLIVMPSLRSNVVWLNWKHRSRQTRPKWLHCAPVLTSSWQLLKLIWNLRCWIWPTKLATSMAV